MVWQKFRTLKTETPLEDLQRGYSDPNSLTWFFEQLSAIQDELNLRGWDNQTDAGQNNNSQYRYLQWGSPLITDLFTGAQKRYRYYVLASIYNYYGNSDKDPYRFDLWEDRNYDGSTGLDKFINSTSANVSGGLDGGDLKTTRKLQFWESTETPQAMLCTSGAGHFLFYWPGFTECYFYEALIPDDYRFQNTIFPITNQEANYHYGNPVNSYGIPQAHIISQRMSNGAGPEVSMPGAVSTLYSDFWWHSPTAVPLYKQPATDVMYYQAAPTGGGNPALSTSTSEAYAYKYEMQTIEYNNEFYGSHRNFWFNFGATAPDWFSDYVAV